jgi:hypothetical protein
MLLALSEVRCGGLSLRCVCPLDVEERFLKGCRVGIDALSAVAGPFMSVGEVWFTQWPSLS